MTNTISQHPLSRPPATLLHHFVAEIIRELSKPAPDLATITALLNIYRAVPITMAREVVKGIPPSYRNRKLRQWPEAVVHSWLESLRLYFGRIAYKSKGQLACLAVPVPTNPLLSTWGETLMWSRALADSPRDAMGEDHFRFMGRFQSYGDAAPDTFEVLALDAFEQRLALSRRYGTWFAEQVSPGWRNGTPRNCYQDRWNSGYDRLVWSFGIKGHPRADQIWHLMRERLPRNPDRITREFPHDVTDIEPALRPETKAVRSWTFDYHTLKFSIYEDQRGNFFLCHARSCDIRDVIRPRLAALWNSVLNRCKLHNERLRCLAEFEWLWYWTNPFVRGGATTGGVLSAFLQRSLRSEGLEIQIPDHFVMQDLYALSSDWKFYVHERVAELACTKEDSVTADQAAM